MAETNDVEKFQKNFIDLQIKHLKKGFKAHLISYVCTNAVFLIINFTIAKGTYWSLFSIAGWGFGVILHFVVQIIPAEKNLIKLAEEAKSA